MAHVPKKKGGRERQSTAVQNECCWLRACAQSPCAHTSMYISCSISTTLPFSPSMGGSPEADPGKGHSKSISAQPAPAEAQKQAGPESRTITDLMWTAELRAEIPPAQPLEEHITVKCDGIEHLLILPQNWDAHEILCGLRSEALRLAKKKEAKGRKRVEERNALLEKCSCDDPRWKRVCEV